MYPTVRGRKRTSNLKQHSMKRKVAALIKSLSLELNNTLGALIRTRLMLAQ